MRCELAGQSFGMPSPKVRIYNDYDYFTVRKLFIYLVKEHANTAFIHLLQKSYVCSPLLVVLLLPVVQVLPPVATTLTLAVILVWTWFGIRYMFLCDARLILSDDLLNIKAYYMNRDGYRFWVGESEGKFAGMMGIIPLSGPDGENHMEIRRLMVCRIHRRKGIAKALCKTAIDFARKRGCRAVIAQATSAQPIAHKCLEKLGFTQTRTFQQPGTWREFLGLTTTIYQYTIPQRR
ncbi:probable N-acetyltransferase camello [Hyperolius riggenbachi]|uniref:probable N-acetyltransferase camello n=1 Tax=Hyperolius riggenbachi TaxID=752182 RepID=UPI0035A2BB59